MNTLWGLSSQKLRMGPDPRRGQESQEEVLGRAENFGQKASARAKQFSPALTRDRDTER